MSEKISPAISVIIPLYNKSDYVLRAAASVFAQTYTDFEVVVIDDGSTDDGPAKLSSAYGDDPRLRIITQPNSGVSAARNRGLAEMRGDLGAFLDADDEWLPQHLENIASVSAAFPDVAIIGTGYRQLCPRGYVAEVAVDSDEALVLPDYFASAIHRSVLTMSSCALRKSAYEMLGGFVEREPLGEDQELYARYALHYPIACHPQVTAVYHNEITSGAMGLYRREWDAREPLIVRRLEEWQAGSIDAAVMESLRRYAVHQFYEHIVFGIKMGNARKARELLGHPLLDHGSTRRRVSLLKTALRLMPHPLVAAYFRLSRSRFAEKNEFRRGGVHVRCLSRV